MSKLKKVTCLAFFVPGIMSTCPLMALNIEFLWLSSYAEVACLASKRDRGWAYVRSQSLWSIIAQAYHFTK